jgi:hypothetical protein
MLKKAFQWAMANPKKALTVAGIVISGLGGAGYTIPDWAPGVLNTISAVAAELAKALAK